MRWIIALVIIFGLLAWGGMAEYRAESSAVEFCDSVGVGSSFYEIVEKATLAGEDRLRIIREDLIVVGFTGITPFSRHFCEISRDEDSVKTKRYVYLD